MNKQPIHSAGRQHVMPALEHDILSVARQAITIAARMDDKARPRDAFDVAVGALALISGAIEDGHAADMSPIQRDVMRIANLGVKESKQWAETKPSVALEVAASTLSLICGLITTWSAHHANQ
ncbi:hypothetical protein FCJ61_25355 [Burkholderia metallica]|uniref:hypothetical protein n=1 Tax=Burkholderia metallica TaxID=488729 RepID=UPI00157AB5AF|nr:hypothetical protein [Burkholderia metallica]NTZ86240.1 hypothetical protein [Burkholderia metallica]